MAALDITRSIDIAAPLDAVWRALTEPELIAQWFGDTAEFDATPGASGAFGWRDHGGAFRIVVEQVDRPKTLVYRWAREFGVDPMPGNSTLVRFDLTATDNGTRLDLLETGFEELADPHGAQAGNVGGWKAELGELVEFVESR
ncbi:activator of HSP90 ATPase [Mycobacterium antarcticum]|uniref:SRPBCC family protein n=1 Tax=unclassified Mycolicibacterium TaxID=2636767 RepID=UPI002394B31E|nr:MULTISPECIES: SRPBCC family protein [unclassified Mycolicibacterium]BDX33902.1 activator of HSP90 ATPase [Mycolicibacterium sp. TUM20985]GLP77076.1 activator of HSP90 ATPase [Mycolicibacterium sp. TUM20983]GLP82502.1 activator of HSP90 ATPase [Mycolicibacterium sp. TUM20984]